MSAPKKTLYEWLQLTSSASAEAIQTAHARLLAETQAQRHAHNAADTDLQIQTLNVAFTTLSSPSSRLAYDDKLAQENRDRLAAAAHAHPAHRAPSVREAPQAEGHPFEAATLSRRANRNLGGPADDAPGPVWLGLLSAAKSSVTKSLAVIGLLALFGTVLQMVYFRSQMANAPISEARTSAEEKAVLQEYFQTHGVRPASRADMDVLELERRRKDQAERELANKTRLKDLEQKRFEEESRRLADEASANLRRSEEEALNRALAKP